MQSKASYRIPGKWVVWLYVGLWLTAAVVFLLYWHTLAGFP